MSAATNSTANSDMEAAPRVRWGVLSTAKIGVNAVMPAIRNSRNGEVAAIASRELTRAERLAAATAGVRAYGMYEELLDDPTVEAVYIPLPNALHAEWTLKAAAHGKHVLCEKPLGTTADEVRRMIDGCRAAGVLLMEAFMYRFHPQIRFALEQVAADAIGPVRAVRSAFAFDIRARPNDIRLRASLAGGSLMDVGCYPLNVCRAVFGGPPQAIAAQAYIPAGREVELAVGAVLDFGDGRMGLIDCSFEQPRHQFIQVVGERGLIYVPRPFTPGVAETTVHIERGDETLVRAFPAVDHYQLEVEHFGDCIRTGAPPAIPLEDSVEQAAAIEGIYRAAGYAVPW